MTWTLSIRAKLLLVLAGLLAVTSGLFFSLHRRESNRTFESLQRVVEELEERLESQARSQTAAGRRVFIGPVRPRFGITRRGEVVIEWVRDWFPLPSEEWEGDRELSRGENVLPADELEILERVRVPIEVAREERLPRELLIAGGIFLLGLGITAIIAGGFSRPIKELTQKMDAVAQGDLEASVDTRRRDELGRMARSFNSMVSGLREKRLLERKIYRAERLAAVGDLAAGVAHDVRNPLNTIGLTLGHLREHFAPEPGERREDYLRYLDDVRAELDRLEELVANFLSLARPDRGESESTDLGSLVREALRLFEKESQAKGVRVETRIAEIDPLLVNPRQIRRALANVLINALKAMDEGEGRLVVSVFGRSSGRATGRPAGAEDRGLQEEVVLRVADSGHGIDEEDLERIFLPYYSTRPDGTGLGLPVARAAVEANGGRIEVRSRRGAGTEVDIVLPRFPPLAGAAADTAVLASDVDGGEGGET